MTSRQQFAPVPSTRAPASASTTEDTIMHSYEQVLAHRRMQEMQEEAQRVSRAHRLYRARKAALRAERAARRAARLSASV
ncbi:hypothetical protein [Candidatus Blastococcus massiliensis]|uniref:hypothetical protein n=1 Tax=Candidatus Blastococcus massiliensis TaxID=1470358 RepID=UPI0004AE13E7|nr:hypothetical protein [Candidatus Blastococcus massiliensis]